MKPLRKMDKFTNTPTEIDTYIEVVHKQLYFAVLKGSANIKLKNNVESLFFTIDDELIYQNYYSDFGPLNIACLYKYCFKMNKYLQYARGFKNVVHYTCSHPDKKSNAACLMGCFCVIYLNNHPKDIWKLLQDVGAFKPFLDASQYPCGFTLRILDILQAIYKGLTFNFFNFTDFNVVEYELYDKLQYGDMNWLIPRKFLAFIGPADNGSAHPPEFYIKYFLKNDIKTIIRLNSAVYDSIVFTNVGINHFDLIFPDGATPPRDILLKFLAIAEMAPAAIAVHCKAGLGRTGSLIGAYLIKHYRMTAREAIAWMRLCRPGSVIGQQQIWLEKIESWLWRTGSQYRVRKYGAGDKIPRHKYGIYSKEWPLEREKIIVEARSKLQRTFTKSQLEQMTKEKPDPVADSYQSNIQQQKIFKKLLPHESSSYKNVSRLMSTVHSTDKNSYITNASDVQNSTYDKQQKFFKYSKQFVSSNNPKKGTIKLSTQGDKLNEKKFTWNEDKIIGKNSFHKR